MAGAAEALRKKWGWRLWLILAAALVLLALLWWRFEPIQRGETLDLEIMNGHGAVAGFRIPRSYFAFRDMPDGREQQLIYLTVYLPDLLPEDAAEKAGYKTFVADGGGLRLPSDQQVVIKLEQSAPDGVKKDFRTLIGERDVRFEGVRADGLEVYAITVRDYSGNYVADPSQGKFLKPVDRDDMYVVCSALDMAAETVRCDIHAQFSDKLQLLIFLARSRLDEWPSVEAKVKKLIASFAVGERHGSSPSSRGG